MIEGQNQIASSLVVGNVMNLQSGQRLAEGGCGVEPLAVGTIGFAILLLPRQISTRGDDFALSFDPPWRVQG